MKNQLVTPTAESKAFDAAFSPPTITPSRYYKTLTDADCLKAGTIEVWYMKPDFFSDGIRGARPSHDLNLTHILLGSIRATATTPQPMSVELLDALWQVLQGHSWSPYGEARDLISSKGLKHTSMSVGDCFKLPSGEVWIVTNNGFKEVGQ